MSDRDPRLEPFDALVGTWTTRATHPMLEGTINGTTTFAWLEGERFLLQRTHQDHPRVPDAIAVIGLPEAGDGLVSEYFDERGVRRTYGVALEDGVLRFWREHPGFDQRFATTLGPDAFGGTWQVAESPGDWRDDLEIAYVRSA